MSPRPNQILPNPIGVNAELFAFWANGELRLQRCADCQAWRHPPRYRCAACGFEAEHYFWQCPGCLGWDTYPPQRLEDL